MKSSVGFRLRLLVAAVRRLDGTEGLSGLGRSIRRSADLQAWCRALMEAVDIDELESLTADCAEPCLPNPSEAGHGTAHDGALS